MDDSNIEQSRVGLFFNKDSERRANFNDNFQSKILKEYSRIINIPVELRKNDVNELIRELLLLLK